MPPSRDIGTADESEMALQRTVQQRCRLLPAFRARLGALLLGLALTAGPAEALNFVVNSTLDTPDVVLDGVCDSDPGVPVVCTLRASIMEVNRPANIPPHTITFNLGAGPYSIAVGAGGLPPIAQTVTINGYSQAGSSANTLAVGSNAVLLIELDGTATPNLSGINGLTIAAPTTVRGLVINRFAGYGILVAAGGATSVIAGNYVGTNTAGTLARGNNRDGAGFEAGIGLLAGSVTIGGTAPADRNLVSGQALNFSRGIELYNSSGNTIQGNYVGTNAAGTARLDNVGAGIGVDGDPGVGSDNNLIGGAVAGVGNLCSGGGTEGIYVSVDSNANTIQGNIIGLNAAGTLAIPNLAQGIKIQSPGNSVGGDTPAKGNVISGNGAEGVRIENNVATGNAVLGNRIYGNGTLGIDLAGDGVTPNDALDGDAGPNNRLNFPVINAVSVVGASLVVSFSLDVPAGSYRVEFFRNPSGVDVPNGEGEVFAGFKNVTHGGGGSKSFSATITGVSGDRITATTTSCTDGGVCAAFSDTSEFSANLIAVPTNYRSIGTAPDDSTGSVNTTNTSQVVAGVGTSWLTINRGRGDVISICDQAFPTCTTSTNYAVLGVGSNSQLTLTTPYAGTTGNHGYTIRRQFTTLTAWEGCIDGQGGSPPPAAPCFYFPAPTSSLVADNRSEVGIAYKDSTFTTGVTIDGSITDAAHTITLTADGSNRHYGRAGQGVVVNNTGQGVWMVDVLDDFVTVEWLEFRNGDAFFGGIRVSSVNVANSIVLRNNLIHNTVGAAIRVTDADAIVDVIDNIVYGVSGTTGIWLDVAAWTGSARLRLFNNTIFGSANYGIYSPPVSNAQVVLRNNIAHGNGIGDFNVDAPDPASSHNLASDLTGVLYSPAGGGINSVPLSGAGGVNFVNTTPGAEDLHINSSSRARDAGADLSSVFTRDIDWALRQAPWDIGADEFSASALFRSVGTTPAALATGAGNALTISGSTATFASALPDNIGVGDVIQYDANGDTLVDALAFIHGRTSSRVYTVKNKAGAAPTAVTGDEDWDIYRAYTTLANWVLQAENVNITEPTENDVNPSVDLVASGTVMHVACYVGGPDNVPVTINGWTTGPENYISIFTPVGSSQVGTSQRHSGAWDATKYRLVGSRTYNGFVIIRDEYVRVTGLQIENTALKGGGGSQRPAGIEVDLASANSDVRVGQNILRNTGGGTGDYWAAGVAQTNGGGTLKVWNNIMYDWGCGVFSEYPTSNPSNVTIYNNTIINSDDVGIDLGGHASGTYRLANNLVQDSSGFNYYFAAGVLPLTYSATNLSQDATSPDGASFQTKTVTFVGAADFHLSAADINAKDLGTNLSTDPVLAVLDDIDGQVRQVPWDIGADDGNGTTAVKLMSFSAIPGDGSVTLEWRTGSELDNLGFHLYRGPSAEGPWTRLTSSLIPGLGSSPLGQAYSWLDSGLVNGTRYHYRLEDVDTASKSTFHGPVWAVPSAPGEDGDGDGGGDGTERGGGEPVPGSCPTWVLSAAPDAVSPICTPHGDPEAASLNLLSRDAHAATLELRTGGFWTLEDASGTVRVFVPGLDFPTDSKAPALPLRRALVDAVVGRQVALVSAEAFELQSFQGLRPSAVGQAEMRVSRDGTVRPARRSVAARFLSRGYLPKEVARLAGTVFQGERKSAVVEITPVRFDGSGQKLVLAGRVRVRLAFAGVAEGEIPTGSGGRVLPRRGLLREVLAQLHTSRRGLHAVRYEALFPTNSRGFSTSLLRLQRQGEAVPFHVEPAGSVFGPGSVLYFFADRTTSSTEYSSEVAYELVRGSGVRMGVVRAQPAGAPVVSPSTGYASFETNRIYQPGLLEAPDLWLWDGMVSGAARAEGFTLSGVDTSTAEMARLAVHLQGGSESGVTTDHHVRLSVNGAEVGEATFAGKRPYRVDVLVPASQLREGANELGVVNVGDTGVSSLVFLDRFEVSYPQAPAARQGVFEGEWAEGGTVEVGDLTGPPVILRDVRLPGPEGSAVRWVTGFAAAPGSVRFQAEAGHRYLVVSPEGLLRPRIGRVPPSTLKAGTNQADYLVIAPREFLEAAQPLLERRRSQGLVSRAVPFEEIASEFGRGQPSAEAIKAFLSHVYHSWQRPSPRYVLLLGDATYDPQRFVSTSWVSPLPALWAKTSYLWTASDPALAAVNGDDSLPDLAIGRLPATTVEQAEALVGKLLAWEDSGQDLSGRAVLVADNPDLGGDFEADVEDVRSSFLAGRSTTTLKLSELGVGTRPAILDSFDDGASLMSYVGHGGAAVWASENVLNSWDTPSLRAQSRQPLLLTMNCLNGYFVASNFDALSEALVKAEGRGAVAAFSPSGLSLDGPAHQYHRALMAELTSGRHERLGDAILAAQLEYARAGTMPELLSVYHLLGDPGMRIR